MEHGDEHVDLLLTDVVLPTMDGKQLHERLLRWQPGLPVLFVSGYTNDVIAKYGLLEAQLLEKPLSQAALLRAVRRSLDSAAVHSCNV
jgi:FixJ family two-component response regulator